MRFLTALTPRLTWMLGTASVLCATNAWAQGAENALGALFGMGILLLALMGLPLVMGVGTLFFNLTRRHSTASIAMGLVMGVITMKVGSWVISEIRDEWDVALLGGGLFLLGAGEIAAAVKAMRARRSQSAAPVPP